MIEIPPHVLLLRRLRETARPLFDRPSAINSQVTGFAVQLPAPQDREAFDVLVRRKLVVQQIVAIPGECHPFEEATVMRLTEAAYALLAQYEVQKTAREE